MNFGRKKSRGQDNPPPPVSQEGAKRDIIHEFLCEIRAGHQVSEALFLEVYSMVQRWFFRFLYVRSSDDYLDIIDEAITRFYERIDDFRGNSSGEFYCYMRSIIRTILDSEKKKKDHSPFELDTDVRDNRGHHVTECMVNHEVDDLYDCIDRLPDKLSRIMYDVLSETPKGEIAKQVEMTPSLLSQNISKAVRLLHACMTSKGYSEQLVFRREGS